MGGADLNSVSSHPQVEVAALCDGDLTRLNSAHDRHPNAKTFGDFREMISSLGDWIDAVVVSTPDHTHAAAAMTALNQPISQSIAKSHLTTKSSRPASYDLSPRRKNCRRRWGFRCIRAQPIGVLS